MDFLELVSRRRSCRKYAQQPVPREKIERCLQAAQLAPSACNSQPWRFIVVDTPSLKEALAQKAFNGIYGINAFAKQAPVLVVVVRQGSSYAAQLGGTLRGIPYSLIDLGIACEHFVLQAQEEGLGTCWLGWFNTRAVRKILGLPPWAQADIIISAGFPEDTNRPPKRRKAMSEIREFR